MQISVVIRSRDEADRLRLTLTSLSRQTLQPEVIVVDDASTDHTSAVLAEAARWLPLRAIHHATPRGRSGATNAGAAIATGEVLLFLDGDTLAHPELVARHASVHAAACVNADRAAPSAVPSTQSDPHLAGRIVARGETFHIRGTRFLLDPESASPRSGEEARIARLSDDERARLRVTRDQILNDFAAVERKAEPGVYPGAGPRRLFELEMDALRHHPACTVLWAAASGSNLSVSREDFLRVGGLHERLDLTEQRELALRLCQDGARMTPVDGARTYHLTHRSGWRDPLQTTAWEDVFYRAHPILAVKLLSVFWATLSSASAIPRQSQIASLPELEVAARGDNGIDYDAVRCLIPGLRALASAQPPNSNGRQRGETTPAPRTR